MNIGYFHEPCPTRMRPLNPTEGREVSIQTSGASLVHFNSRAIQLGHLLFLGTILGLYKAVMYENQICEPHFQNAKPKILTTLSKTQATTGGNF